MNIFGNIPLIPFLKTAPEPGPKGGRLTVGPNDRILANAQYHSDIMSQLTITTPDAVLDYNKSISLQEEMNAAKLVHFASLLLKREGSKSKGRASLSSEESKEGLRHSEETKETPENYFVYYQSVKRKAKAEGRGSVILGE